MGCWKWRVPHIACLGLATRGLMAGPQTPRGVDLDPRGGDFEGWCGIRVLTPETRVLIVFIAGAWLHSRVVVVGSTLARDIRTRLALPCCSLESCSEEF